MIQVLLDVIELEESKPRERIAFTPSRSYKRQMKAMLANPLRWAKNKARPMWKKVLHSAAVALLILSVGLGGVMAISPAARAAVVRWVTEWYETHIVYRYSGRESVDTMPQYEINWLPEGYAESKDDRIEFRRQVDILLSVLGGLGCISGCNRVWRYKQKCMKYSEEIEIVARYLKESEYESVIVWEKEASEGLITVIETNRAKKAAVENSEAAEALKRIFADAKCEVIDKIGLQVFFQFTSTLDTSAGIAFSLATPKDFYHDGDQFVFLEALCENYYYYLRTPQKMKE